MEIKVEPGRYVVAVSGGVDSMALLHMLQKQPGLKLTVAHLDHGIRPDSAADRQLVQETARQYGVPFVYDEALLGPETGEAEARQARYEFLRGAQQAAGAQAIMTAHHQDDVLETAILNILRGTGRKGLSSLSSRHDLVRPLLDVPRRELVAYARDQGLKWHEDSTNQDEIYLRNYIRRRLLPQFDEPARQQLRRYINNIAAVNREIDNLLMTLLHLQPLAGTLERQWFNSLPHNVAREVMAAWLRAHGCRDFDRKTLERLVVAAKTAAPGKKFPIQTAYELQVLSEHLALNRAER